MVQELAPGPSWRTAAFRSRVESSTSAATTPASLIKARPRFEDLIPDRTVSRTYKFLTRMTDDTAGVSCLDISQQVSRAAFADLQDLT